MMITGNYFGRKSNISEKTGKPWYMLNISGITVTGNGTMAPLFCTKTAYDEAEGLQYMQPIKLASGLNDNGKLTIAHIRPDKE